MGNREHRYVDRRLSAYVDGELAHRQRARVESHLARCQECRASLRSLRWTKELLHHAPAVRVPRSFVVREADVARRRRRVVRRPLLATQWATAVVALLFVLVLGGDLLLGARLPGGPSIRQLRGVKGAIPSPVLFESEQVAAVEEAVTVPAAEDVPAAEAAPVEDASVEAPAAEAEEAPVEEAPVEKAVPEAGTARDLAPGQPATVTAPAEPMMALEVPEQVYTETQQVEATVPEVATPGAAETPSPDQETRAEGAAQDLPAEGGGEVRVEPTQKAIPAPEEVADEWAETTALGAYGRAIWLGAEALLGVALVGLVIAVLWMRLRR
jgi:hypothetical protein